MRQARKKQVVSRGGNASVTPGGDGFECPASGCKSVFDTAEEALEHGATHGLSGEREVDGEGKSCCLWQGCGKKIKVVCPSERKPKFKPLREHEALHTKGPKPREGFVCPECDKAYPTSAAAWACAATHGVGGRGGGDAACDAGASGGDGIAAAAGKGSRGGGGA